MSNPQNEMTKAEVVEYLAMKFMNFRGGGFTGGGLYFYYNEAGDVCYFRPDSDLNHLATVLGELSEEQWSALVGKVIEADELPCMKMPKPFDESTRGIFTTGFTGALLLFANEPATLCRLIVEAVEKKGE